MSVRVNDLRRRRRLSRASVDPVLSQNRRVITELSTLRQSDVYVESKTGPVFLRDIIEVLTTLTLMSRIVSIWTTNSTTKTNHVEHGRLRPILDFANFDFGQFLDVEFWDHKWGPEGWRPKP